MLLPIQHEIQELKRKNEVLEEQGKHIYVNKMVKGIDITHGCNYLFFCLDISTVHALEAARALGSSENAEDILQSVAEKVETKQRQQQNKANSTVRTQLHPQK